MFGGGFAPQGWAACDGQLMPIQQNQALYSILGTTYGGDGRATFALPDLRSRAAVHRSGDIRQGQGSDKMGVAQGDTPEPGYLAVLFIIAVQGQFPQRSS